MIFQVFNKRIGAWVKMKKMANGRTKILNVKQRDPKKCFKGITKR